MTSLPEEVINVKGYYYILAQTSNADENSRVIKNNDTFAVFDPHGDIRPLGVETHGLYHDGTRFLSRAILRINGQRPLLLSSTVKEDNHFLSVDLMNMDFTIADGKSVRQGSIHIHRNFFLWKGAYYEELEFTNVDTQPLSFYFDIQYDADYVDIFEVRGIKRKENGESEDPSFENNTLAFKYTGLDKKIRVTSICISEPVQHYPLNKLRAEVSLKPHQKATFNITVVCSYKDEKTQVCSYKKAFQEIKQSSEEIRQYACKIRTSNHQFNAWLDRSSADLQMMLTKTDLGLYPYAGIPWYSTIFGRDGIITGLETLWFFPEISKGVLNYLANHQAQEANSFQDAEPGKILHEQRKGEMAALKEIPFGNYYGTIDATPLFILLAGHYFKRTGDGEFIKTIWPNIKKAIEWMDKEGDRDADGFLEYQSRTEGGLSQQGWKDSDDSVFHQDGSSAAHPVALCEVQAYAYEAKKYGAEIAAYMGEKELARTLSESADLLKKNFLEKFWCPDLEMYALALDGKKRPCKVKSSNAGQCLISGIAEPEHARHIAKQMMSPIFFTGWGIRTIASNQARYNPMSYHNGSIWPHDNALVAYGFSRYGLKEECLKIFSALFDASLSIDLYRIPELYCGFERKEGEGPTLYPVACLPQAWSCSAIYLLLQSCLGLTINALEKQVTFRRPLLPVFLDEVIIEKLHVNEDTYLDLKIERYADDVGISIIRRQGQVDLIVIK